MSDKSILLTRSGASCELCEGKADLSAYAVPPFTEGLDRSVLVCSSCLHQLTGGKPMEANYWRCLNKTMWSSEPAVQVVVWRILNALREEGWPQDLLDMLYLDDEVLQWAKSIDDADAVSEEKVIHKDSNGTILQTGDSVVLIKDLEVKGGGFTAKRGTAVRNIILVEGNADQIEGKVNGQQIVILTKFVKKT
jgi:protein PhnA